IGDAIWWHVHAGGALFPDAAHSYELPRAEAMKIAGLVCFSGEGMTTELGADTRRSGRATPPAAEALAG
ncbi:MAG: DUF427 domain-containing protein, partial [Actinobacteria bacterium]|nr:DUF427 domain-containing protein [Actinomycetota bacterium]